jgi:hypothetical protein
MIGLNVNENAVTLKATTDLSNTEVRILESGSSQRISASNLLAGTEATVAKKSKKRITNVTTEAIRIGSDKKAVSAEGNLGAGLKMQWDGIDKKAILTFDCGMPSTYPEAYLFPFINGLTDANGLGQLFWLVQHAYLNKGKPVGGGAIAQNRRIITTDNITTATGTNHVITVQGHGLINGQDVVPWCFSGHDGQTSGRFYGFPHSMGKTLYVEVLSADTYRLHRNSGLTLPLNLRTANFPTAGTSGSVTYASNVLATGTYSQTAVTKTVQERGHGYTVGQRAETPDGTYPVATVPNANSFTYVYNTVTVTKASHGLAIGDYINFDAITGTGVDGWRRIVAVTTDTFTFLPFESQTTNGDCTYYLPLVVTDSSHGIATGDFVRLAPTTGNLATGVYVVNRINTNSYSIRPMELTGGLATTGGNANVRRNMWAVVVDAWDWHGHTSVETMWRDGTVNTMEGWTYGLNYPIKRANGLMIHWSGCRFQYTGESGTNVEMILGRDHEVPSFALRLNSSENYDLIRFDNTYSTNVVYRAFASSGHFQVGGGNTDHGGQLSVRSTTASDTLLALVDDSTTDRSKSFKTEIAKVQTTNNTQTTLWSKTLADPSVSPNKINLLSVKARITVYDITGEGLPTPEIEIGEFEITASARRRVGFTNTKGTSMISVFNNSTGLTTGSFAVDTSGGALRIRVTGETSKTYDFVAKVEYHEYMTP